MPGAKLQLIDDDGNIIDEWISDTEPHMCSNLEEGKHYRLIETLAPYGYEISEEIEFQVSTDKETQLIEMKDAPILKDITVIKIDSETKEVIKDKFTFALYEDEKCTKLIMQEDSDKENGTVTFRDIRYGTYFIKEQSSPEKYDLSNRIVKVEINDKGVFFDGQLTEEKDNSYSFEFENVKTPEIYTGANISYYILIIIAMISFAGITAGSILLKKENDKLN